MRRVPAGVRRGRRAAPADRSEDRSATTATASGTATGAAITHGPRAGAHTLNEWVSIDDLERVAHLYTLTAVAFCSGAA